MRALVIGYGSAGSRHAKILKKLGCAVAVVSRREIDFSPRFPTVSEAIKKASPDYVVIANRTHEHYKTLLELKKEDFRGTVLIEKPLFQTLPQKPPDFLFTRIFTGYNLRFHPLLKKLKAFAEKETLVSAQIYVGQYLPNWRPQRDFRRTYSAHRKEGGGVLWDLSHELDYVNWIFGDWRALTALGGHFSSLEITSDDVFSLLMITEKCPVVSIQMNYLDRNSRREILVNTNRSTVKVDLIQGSFQVNERIEKIGLAKGDTFRLEHQAVLKTNYDGLCTFADGMEVQRMITAAEKASRNKVWIFRNATKRCHRRRAQ